MLGTQGKSFLRIPADTFATTFNTAPMANSSNPTDRLQNQLLYPRPPSHAHLCPSLSSLFPSTPTIRAKLTQRHLNSWTPRLIPIQYFSKALLRSIWRVCYKYPCQTERGIRESGGVSESTQNEQLQRANARDAQPQLQTRKQPNFKAWYFKRLREMSN